MKERPGPAFPRVVQWRNPAGDRAGDVTPVELHGFAKISTTDKPNVVANEFVAHRIGSLMGLPVVPGAAMLVSASGHTLAWVSLAFDGDVRKQTPSIKPEQLATAEPDLTAGIVVFDLLIANLDRHRRNLAYRRAGRPKGERVALFDHDHSLWGNSGLSPRDHLERVSGQFILDGPGVSNLRRNRHCLIDHVTSLWALEKWCSRARTLLPDSVIAQACNEAAALDGGPNQSDADALNYFLRMRRDRLFKLIQDNVHHFPRTQQSDGTLL